MSAPTPRKQIMVSLNYTARCWTASQAITDVEVQNHGSVFLFDPLTDAAREWIDANVPEDAVWFAGALAVEHRFARDLADGMLADGLVVR